MSTDGPLRRYAGLKFTDLGKASQTGLLYVQNISSHHMPDLSWSGLHQPVVRYRCDISDLCVNFMHLHFFPWTLI